MGAVSWRNGHQQSTNNYGQAELNAMGSRLDRAKHVTTGYFVTKAMQNHAVGATSGEATVSKGFGRVKVRLKKNQG